MVGYVAVAEEVGAACACWVGEEGVGWFRLVVVGGVVGGGGGVVGVGGVFLGFDGGCMDAEGVGAGALDM